MLRGVKKKELFVSRKESPHAHSPPNPRIPAITEVMIPFAFGTLQYLI